MKQVLTLAVLLFLPVAPLWAQETEEGRSLMERGGQLFMEGLRREMAPALEDLSELGDRMAPALRNFTQEMGPKMGALLEQVDDWSLYEVPEMLLNGDIIIRRKPAPETGPKTRPETPAPQIEL